MAASLLKAVKYANIEGEAAGIVSGLSVVMGSTADKVKTITELQNSGIIRDWLNDANGITNRQILRKVRYNGSVKTQTAAKENTLT